MLDKIRIDKNNYKKWNDFVLKQDNYTPFFDGTLPVLFEKDKNFKAEGYLYLKNEQIIGGFIALNINEFSGIKSKFSNRVIINGTPLFNDEIIPNILEDIKYLYNGNQVYTEIWNTKSFKPTDKELICTEHLNYIININRSSDDIFSSISKSTRKKIKKGLNELTIRSITDESEFIRFYKCLEKTHQRKQIPLLPKKVLKKFFNNNIGHFIIAEKDNNILSARLFLEFGNVIYDWIAGDDEKYSQIPSAETIIWFILDYAAKKGLKFFNFGGAGKPDIEYGPREFKRRFGGELVNYGRVKYINSYLKQSMLNTYLKMNRND